MYRILFGRVTQVWKNELLLKRRCWIIVFDKNKIDAYTHRQNLRRQVSFVCKCRCCFYYISVWIALAFCECGVENHSHRQHCLYVNWRWIRFIVSSVESISFLAAVYIFSWKFESHKKADFRNVHVSFHLRLSAPYYSSL